VKLIVPKARNICFLKFRLQGFISPTCLLEAFMCKDSKSAKRQPSRQCIFALSGSARMKAACKTLVKLTSEAEWNFSC